MKRNTPILIGIITLMVATGTRAQNMHQQKPAFDFTRKGSLLIVKNAAGKELNTIDLDKPAFKGKVVAFTYSAKKDKGLARPEGVASTVTIFPNPAFKEVNLQFKGSWKYPVDIQILDKNGNTLQTTQLQSAEQPLSVESLTQGFYILKAQSGNASAVEKLVVQ
jgi:hypothetical protein